MYDFEVSTTVMTSPDRLFGYLADVRHLPDYFPKVLAAKGGDDEEIALTFDLDGEPFELHGWMRADPYTRRLQWGVPEAGYQGWLSVSPTPHGCELTVNLQAPALADRRGYGDFDVADQHYELVDTVENIRQIMRRTRIARQA
ncbi:MAG TPA: SRPBCC family protein [Micromonosporaceae bacterium]|nr:SRPBCC family protein [Micromonosporaceae bacterium]